MQSEVIRLPASIGKWRACQRRQSAIRRTYGVRSDRAATVGVVEDLRHGLSNDDTAKIHPIVGVTISGILRIGHKIVSAATLMSAINAISTHWYWPLRALEAEAEQRHAIRRARRGGDTGDGSLAAWTTVVDHSIAGIKRARLNISGNR